MMAILKAIFLLLIISSIYVDARSRRKRRQLSASSYYISNVNPYSTSYNPTAPLTYPSGSYYSAPGYGYPNTGYSSDRPYDSTAYGTGYNTQYPYGSSQVYQYQNLGSTYGSGLYSADPSGLLGYALPGFNNQYPNWNQGNSIQYYTGGTGTGLTNTGYTWYRSGLNNPALRGVAPTGTGPIPGNIPELNPPLPPNLPPGFNPPPVLMKKSASKRSSRK